MERLWLPPVFVPIILLIEFDATDYDPEHERFESIVVGGFRVGL